MICCTFFSFAMAPEPLQGLDIISLDGAVQHYLFLFSRNSPSTHKTYQAALKQFAILCFINDILFLFPISEHAYVLCYFTT